MDTNIISVIIPLLGGIPFFLTAIMPKKNIAVIRVVSQLSGQTKGLKEAYAAAEKKIEKEDNGCALAIMVMIGVMGSIITLCYLSDVVPQVFRR